MRHLLVEKHFDSITTAEIASTAATNEALIYRYFGGKRGLLHQVLSEYLEEMLDSIHSDLGKIDDPIKRLQRIIWDTLDIYNRHRVFAKIVLIEVRSFPKYFESDTYQLVKDYARLYVDIINEAVKCGQFRNDIPPAHIRDAIIGCIEQLMMPAVTFSKSINVDTYAKAICEIVLRGIVTRRFE